MTRTELDSMNVEDDAHHQLVRWGLEMVGPDGVIAFNGIDVALLDVSRKFSCFAGFFVVDLAAAL